MALFKSNKSSEQIVRDIRRVQVLRKNSDDAVYLERLKHLQQWQTQRMEHSYHELMADPYYRSLLDFFLHDIFRGIDLSEVEDKLDRVSQVVSKLFTGTDMLFAVLEFNAVTGELDQILTETLFECMKVDTITPENYAQACREANVFNTMLRQKQLVKLFADDLNKTVRSKLIYAAIKLAKLPAQKAGFGDLYQMIEKGFTVLSELENPEVLIGKIIEHEKQIVESIHNESENPFKVLKMTEFLN
jgi:hypothetical protein